MSCDAHLLGACGDGVELIRLTGIRAVGHHGYFAEERAAGQPFVVDVTLQLRRPERDDALAGTCDYGAVAHYVVAAIESRPVDLIETLAGRIADACLTQPVVRGVVVTVHKPEAPIAVPFGDVSVTLVRVRP